MTFQAYCFLRKMKKAQRQPDGDVYIDFEGLEMMTVVEKGQPRTVVPIRQYKNSICSILDYLKQEKLIVQLGLEHFKLPQAGYYYLQTLLSGLARFLLGSVLVPIVVAIITTLITLWLGGGSNSTPAP